METPVHLYIMIQRKRLRFSLLFFALGLLVFLPGAVIAYLYDAQPIAVMLAGISLWSSSIVYHLYDVSRSLLSIVEQGFD